MSAIFFQIQTGIDTVLTEEPTEKTMTIKLRSIRVGILFDLFQSALPQSPGL